MVRLNRLTVGSLCLLVAGGGTQLMGFCPRTRRGGGGGAKAPTVGDSEPTWDELAPHVSGMRQDRLFALRSRGRARACSQDEGRHLRRHAGFCWWPGVH